jgi:hypothetical protein
MQTALAGAVCRPVVLAEFEFDSGTVNLWSGMGDLVWDSKTWSGVGALIGVEFPEESIDGVISGATFSLTGVDNAWISIGLSENAQGRAATLWYAERDDAGVIISDPIKFFSGVMDVMPIVAGESTCTIQLTIERRTYDQRPEGSLYDNESQQRKFPNDKGLEFIPALQEKQVSWGVPSSSSSGGGVGSVGVGATDGSKYQPPNYNRGNTRRGG